QPRNLNVAGVLRDRANHRQAPITNGNRDIADDQTNPPPRDRIRQRLTRGTPDGPMPFLYRLIVPCSACPAIEVRTLSARGLCLRRGLEGQPRSTVPGARLM